MTPTPPERNNPGYTPEYKELEEAREVLKSCRGVVARTVGGEIDPLPHAIYLLAAEVRVMRLERALER
jgi:hypothetical protein